MLAFLTIVLGLAGCAGREQVDRTHSATTEVVAAGESRARGTHDQPTSRIIGWSSLGRDILAYRFEPATSSRETVVMIATIHGDEWAGTPLLEELRRRLARRPELLAGRIVVLVPLMNPDGRLAHRRYNDNRVDLNRNFPSANWSASSKHGVAPLAEPESRAVHDLIESVRPARVISIHQPVGCIDFDGPGRALAEAMAGRCELPVRQLGGRDGSLGSWAGIDGGIPTITVELPRGAQRLDVDALWDAYGGMLLAAIDFPASAQAGAHSDPASGFISGE